MNANELRIGNIVFDTEQGITDTITAIEEGRVSLQNAKLPYTPIEKIKSISLTEEWLLRFGFEQKYDYTIQSTHFENKHCWVYIINQKGENPFFEFEWITPAGRFNLFQSFYYVHQLQNLFLALTGKELELKPEKGTAQTLPEYPDSRTFIEIKPEYILK